MPFQPTASLTQTQYGLTRADHGYSFEHNGRLFFRFGDTHPTPQFNGKPNSQTDLPRIPDANDAIGYVSDTITGPILRLNFITDSIGAYRNPVVLDAQGHPAIRLRPMRARLQELVMVGGCMYSSGRIIRLTLFLLPHPGHSSRSVMAVSDDDGNTFHYLYNVSVKPTAKFVEAAIAKGKDGYIYFWGTQVDTLYRKSPAYLARKPVGSMADSTAIEYLNSVKPDGTPVFMPGEENAKALFHDSLPGPGNTMVVADGMNTLGVEWNPEVWSNDVVSYPQALSATQAAGIFVVTDVVSPSVDEPGSFVLRQNYPDPFNPATTIEYEIPTTSRVRLLVYDLLGREVATLVDNVQPGGSHAVHYDASGLASGIYFYRLVADQFVQTRKMVVSK
jgi:hypothetical protein